MMKIEEKNKINKRIRSYNGDNSFLQSLKRQLKNNKYLAREKMGNRNLKVLSDRQYRTALDLL